MILSLVQRLHLARFSQQSMSVRNMTVQPGPLSVPPSKRSKKTPSFRIIDFGRGKNYNDGARSVDQDVDEIYKEFEAEEREAAVEMGLDWICSVY